MKLLSLVFPLLEAFTQAPGSPFAVGTRPTDVVLADANGDGKLDVVTANAGSRNVSVLLGDGAGGLRPGPGSPWAVPIAAHLVAAGDFNGDRKMDLALTEHDSYRVTVLLGDGRGRLAPAPGSPFAAAEEEKPHNHGLALADVNGDSRLDILTSNHNHSSFSVLLGDGRGGFRPSSGSPFAVGRGPYPLAVVDFNADGKADVVTPNLLDGTMAVLLGNGKGSFAASPSPPYAVEKRPYQVAVGDFDGDKKIDLAVSHDDISLVAIQLGNGKGGFRPAPGSPLDLGRPVYSLVTSDLDADGRADLVAGHPGTRYVTVLKADAKGRFSTVASLAAGGSPNAVAVGDLNGDEKPDIVTASDTENTVSVLLQR